MKKLFFLILLFYKITFATASNLQNLFYSAIIENKFSLDSSASNGLFYYDFLKKKLKCSKTIEYNKRGNIIRTVEFFDDFKKIEEIEWCHGKKCRTTITRFYNDSIIESFYKNVDILPIYRDVVKNIRIKKNVLSYEYFNYFKGYREKNVELLMNNYIEFIEVKSGIIRTKLGEINNQTNLLIYPDTLSKYNLVRINFYWESYRYIEERKLDSWLIYRTIEGGSMENLYEYNDMNNLIKILNYKEKKFFYYFYNGMETVLYSSSSPDFKKKRVVKKISCI